MGIFSRKKSESSPSSSKQPQVDTQSMMSKTQYADSLYDAKPATGPVNVMTFDPRTRMDLTREANKKNMWVMLPPYEGGVLDRAMEGAAKKSAGNTIVGQNDEITPA